VTKYPYQPIQDQIDTTLEQLGRTRNPEGKFVKTVPPEGRDKSREFAGFHG
jgi:hypothetical protein